MRGFYQRFKQVIFIAVCLTAPVWPAFAQADSAGVTDSGPRTYIFGGDENYPPYEYRDEHGLPAGFNVELTKELMKVTGLDIEIRLSPWQETRQALLDGEIDAVQGLFFSEERDQHFNFSQPHQVIHHAVVHREDMRQPTTAVEDLRGLTIGVLNNDIMHDYLLTSQLTTNIVTFQQLTDVIAAVRDNTCDAALTAVVPTQQIILHHSWNKLHLSSFHIQCPPYCYGVSEGQTNLLKQINDGLRILQTNGVMARLESYWLGSDSAFVGHRHWQIYEKWMLPVSLGVTLLIVVFVLWIIVLRITVRRRTRELREARDDALQRMHASRQTEEQIKNFNENLEIAADAAGVAFFQYDIEANLVQWDQRMYRLYGAEETSDENHYELWRKMVHPEDLKKTEDILQESIENSSDFQATFRITRQNDGEMRYIRAYARPSEIRDGRTVNMSGLNIDITEEMNRERMMRRDQRILEMAGQVALLGGWEVTPDSDEVVWSKSTRQIHGVPDDYKPDINEAIRFFHPDDQEKIRTAVDALIHENKPYDLRLRFISRDKRNLWVRTRGIGEFSNGKCERIFGTIQDITESVIIQQKLEQSLYDYKILTNSLQDTLQELEDAQHLIVQQERMNALGQMASGVAHDFNNLLMVIMGMSDILLKNPDMLDNREQTLEMLQQVHQAGKDGQHVVSRLREVYKKQDLEHQPVSLSEVIVSAVDMTEPRWKTETANQGKQIHVETELEDVPAVMGNEAQLREVLMNLIFNATDAIEGDGCITLKLSYDSRQHQVVLECIDTGKGMDEKTLEFCMEPFFTSKGERGSGLGLPMVQNIIRHHAGMVEVESEPGKGTVIRLYIPATEEVKDEVAGPEETPLSGLRVLIADDEANALSVLRQMLYIDQHSITVSSNGHQAVEKLQKNEFDLLITDRAMPGMNGDELIRNAHQIQPGLRIIMATGFGGMIEARGEQLNGVHYLLKKPFTIHDLRQAILHAMKTDTPTG